MQMLLKLIKPKVLSIKNSMSAKVMMRRSPFIAIGIGFWILLYIGMYKTLFFVRSLGFPGEIISAKLFSMIFFGLTGFLILSNVITAISSFYLSKEVPFLLTKPVAIRDIIRLKSFETFLNSSWMVLSFVPPVFIAFGVSYHASAWYYIVISSVFIMFLIMTAGIGICIAHMLTKFFSAGRARTFLLGAGILLFLLLYFMMKSVIPNTFETPEDLFRPFMAFKTDLPFLPGYWITEIILPLLQGRAPESFYFIVLISNSLFFSLCSSMAGIKFFRSNIEKLRPSGRGLGRGLFYSVYPKKRSSVLYKDILVFCRDTGQWSQVSIIGALVMVYIYNFTAIPIDALAGITPFMKELLLLINMIMAGLVLSAVTARFLYTSVSLEGEAFWIIRTSPINITRFLWSKFIYGCTAVTVLLMLIVFFADLAINISGILMYASVGTILMLCISVSGLGTGLGAINPKLRYENIASVSMSLGGMTFMVLAFFVVIITLALEVRIFLLWRSGLDIPNMIQAGVCLLLIAAVNGAALILPMKVGAKKLSEFSL